MGRTVSRTQGAQTTSLLYQGTGETLVQEAAATTTNYAYSPSGPLATDAGGAVSFFVKNPHGDVVASAVSGSLVSSRIYSPYGEPIGGASSSLGYQGQRTDAATGLVDMATRHYDPSMGRFISQDSVFGDLNSPMSLNQYAYAAGNPVTMWDPTGMACQLAGKPGHLVSTCSGAIDAGAGSRAAREGNDGYGDGTTEALAGYRAGSVIPKDVANTIKAYQPTIDAASRAYPEVPSSVVAGTLAAEIQGDPESFGHSVASLYCVMLNMGWPGIGSRTCGNASPGLAQGSAPMPVDS